MSRARRIPDIARKLANRKYHDGERLTEHQLSTRQTRLHFHQHAYPSTHPEAASMMMLTRSARVRLGVLEQCQVLTRAIDRGEWVPKRDICLLLAKI